MPFPLDNDTRGELGEKLFDYYCVRAGLISNPSVRDRTGWDRIVEFPHPPLADLVTIDKRPAPISCHFQIKTIGARARRCRLRLSSAERLAKDPKPAFIYVIADVASQTPSATLIHLAGPALARILKHLRREHRDAGPAAQVNEKYIDLPLSLGTPLPAGGEQLRAAIETAIGGANGLHDYIAQKTIELATLGYDSSSHVGNVTIKSATMEELVDGLLGLRPLTSTSFLASERRFGIEIPILCYEDITSELRIEPANRTACRLVCKIGTSRPTASLDGEIRLPALGGLPKENVKILFRHALFDMKIPLATDLPFNLSVNEAMWRSGTLDAKVWLNAHRLLAYLGKVGTSLQFHSEGLPPIEFFSKSTMPTTDPDYDRFCERVGANLVRLQEILGIDTFLVTRAEFLTSGEDVATALAFVDEKAGSGFATLSTIGSGVAFTSDPLPILYCFAFPVGEVSVHYAVRSLAHISRSGDELLWSLDAERLIDIGWSKDPDRDFPAFQARVAERTDSQIQLSWGSSRFWHPPASRKAK